MFRHTKIYEVIRDISNDSLDAFSYVHAAIQRSKINIKNYLSRSEEYNCDNWCEESITVITGVIKRGRSIKIVVRPSDGGEIIIFYSAEFDALDNPDTELWVDNSVKQELITFGRALKNMGSNRIPLGVNMVRLMGNDQARMQIG